METGEILDYAMKLEIFFEYKARNTWEKTFERYKKCYIKHEKVCVINIVSSREKEKAAAVTMFSHSIEKHNL